MPSDQSALILLSLITLAQISICFSINTFATSGEPPTTSMPCASSFLAILDVKVTEEVFTQIKQHFDTTQIVELTSAIATYNMVARFLVALGVSPEA